MHDSQVGFISGMQSFFNIRKSINITKLMNISKEKVSLSLYIQRKPAAKFSMYCWQKYSRK